MGPSRAAGGFRFRYHRQLALTRISCGHLRYSEVELSRSSRGARLSSHTAVKYDRLVLALDDTQLEQFVREWVANKKNKYVEVARVSGPGDLGRDVVGFLSASRHQGDWHNYQCKQFGRNLPTADAIRELGKILYHAHRGEFTAPSRYFFVAPRGINRNLEKLIFNPTLLRDATIGDWNQYCANKIVDGRSISLTRDLRSFIENFDFSRVTPISVDDILADADAKPVLHKWFGTDPGPAPVGAVPDNVQVDELGYIMQLADAYSESAGHTFMDHSAIPGDSAYGRHLRRQRERFYDAAAFKRFYRDSTDPEVLSNFDEDIFHGVIDICDAQHPNALTRVDAVMAQAATVQPSGPLAQHARVPVKQGVCHHLANDRSNPRLKWRK